MIVNILKSIEKLNNKKTPRRKTSQTGKHFTRQDIKKLNTKV